VKDADGSTADSDQKIVDRRCDWLEQLLTTPEEACRELATLLAARLLDGGEVDGAADEVLGNQVAEAERVTSVNKSGTAAQIEPVETTRPINLAGGALSFAGTARGPIAVAAMSINPWAVAAPDNVVAQRLLDLTVAVPFEVGGQTDVRTGAIRLRMNVAALTNTSGLTEAFDDYLQEAGNYETELANILEDAPDTRKCVAHIWETGEVAPKPCGTTLEAARVGGLRSVAYAKIREARRAADRYYYGLDLRADIGDETVEDADHVGVALITGIAGGVRLFTGTWDFELRGRADALYFDSGQADPPGGELDPVFAVGGALGLVFSGPVNDQLRKQRLGIGVGLEGKGSPSGTAMSLRVAPTNNLDFTAMIVVPATTGADLSLGLRVPIMAARMSPSTEQRGTTVTVSGDFGLFGTSPSAPN